MKSELSYLGDALIFGSKSTDLTQFIEAYQSPFYLYDMGMIADRVRAMQAACPTAKIFFAMKANSHLQILKRMRLLGIGADVVSGGEVRRALEAGFQPREIIFSGVGKTKAEIELAVQIGIQQINVESIPELERISLIASRLRKKARVAFRVNPDVNIQTHPYIATGLSENKFGLEVSALPRVHEILTSSDWIEPVGLSLHLGSQMKEFSGLKEALKKLKEIFFDFQSRYSSVHIFDAGGGLGIDYEEGNHGDLPRLQQYANVLSESLKGMTCDLQLEPGRWFVARAGVLVAQVQYVKETSSRTFLILDTGMSHLARPSLYQAYHRIFPLRKTSGPEAVYDVVGPVCESADFIAKQRHLPKMVADQLVVIADVGAYGYTMANNYNLIAMPEERIIPE